MLDNLSVYRIDRNVLMIENLYRWLITETDVCHHIKRRASQTTENPLQQLENHWSSPYSRTKILSQLPRPRIMSSRQIPPFNSSHDVLPYIARHRWQMTMPEIMNSCIWAMDPAAVERDTIQAFLQSLPRLQLEELTEKDCPICLDEYGSDSVNDTPTKLPCGHILGADCVRTWLVSGRDTCPQCRQQIFFRPVTLEFFSHPHLQLLELRGAARIFLEETDGQSDQSYRAFRRWATGDAIDMNSMAYRRLASNAIDIIETRARII